MSILQCPSYPPTTYAPFTTTDPVSGSTITIDKQTMTYVTSGINIPYTVTGTFNFTGAEDAASGAGKLGDDKELPGPSVLAHVIDGHQDLFIDTFEFHDIWNETHFWWEPATSRMVDDDRHQGGGNILFFDSHSETISITDIAITDFSPFLDPNIYGP